MTVDIAGGRGSVSRWLCFAVMATLTVSGGVALAQDEAAAVSALLRDLASPEFEKAVTAAQSLAKYPRSRGEIVRALVEAIKTGDWQRCGGDMRDTIARTLAQLSAREAVVPLLELAKSGKTIDHECVE